MIEYESDIIRLSNNDKYSFFRYYKIEEDKFNSNFISKIIENDLPIKKRIFFTREYFKRLNIFKFIKNINIEYNRSIYHQNGNNLYSNLICPVCLDLFIFPVITFCSHAYCRACIYQYSKYYENCVICSKMIRQHLYIENLTMMKIIKKYVLINIKNASQSKYYMRLRLHKRYLKGRKLNFITTDMEVDFRDSDFKWMKGIIKEIKKYKNVTLGTIHVFDLKSGSNVVRYTNLNSDSIASSGFYTN